MNLTGVADLDGLQRPFIDLNKTVQPGETVDAGEWQFSIPDGVSAFRFAVTVEAATPYYAGLEAVLNPTGGAGSPNVVAQFLNRPSAPPVWTGRLENVTFGPNSGNLAYDAAGNLYVSEFDAPVIRRVSASGNVTIIAGRDNISGTTDGTGSQARFDGAAGILVNREGTEFLLANAQANTIRRIALNVGADPTIADNWSVTTIAGTATVSGDTDGSGTVAKFKFPWGMSGLNNDSIYISETNGNRIRLLRYVGGDRAQASSWVVQFVCGSTIGVSGFVDAFVSDARFWSPYGISLTKGGTLYIADFNNRRVRALNTNTGLVSTVAGSGDSGSSDSLIATNGTISAPLGLVSDDSGVVYVSSNGSIRRILNGTLKTVAGAGNGSGTTGDKVQFSEIYGLGINRQGEVTLLSSRRLVRLTRKLGR